MKELVTTWFKCWETGNLEDLPITDSFTHQSPFGTINGKQTYLDLVAGNKEKFLGYTFELLDAIYDKDKACVRYKAKQGTNFDLEVSEWYYRKGELIDSVVAYYHIGEIREERQLKS